MLNHVVIPLSLKESDQKILSMGRLLRYFGTKQVSLVHVRTNKGQGKKEERLTETIRAYALKLRELGFETDMYFKQGHIASEILAMATELEADYLSIFWERKWVLQKALLGSVDADVVRMADLPVFVYKHFVFMAKEQKMSQAMYATNFQITDSHVMPYLTNPDFATQSLYILHVGERAPDPQAEAERRKQVQQNLNRLKAECEHAFYEIQTMEVVGHPGAKIVHLARRYGVDLLIIGKCDTQSAFEQIMGSTSQLIADKATCSIFIVPGAQRR
jgi:nucleotide-binding universal stress UspA family protein